jgi:hypothetical protein
MTVKHVPAVAIRQFVHNGMAEIEDYGGDAPPRSWYFS